MNRVVRLKTPDGPITSPSGEYEPLSRTTRGMGLWAAECSSWLDFLLFTLAGGSRTMSHLLNHSSYSAAEAAAAKASALVLHLLATFQVLSISLLLLCLIQTSGRLRQRPLFPLSQPLLLKLKIHLFRNVQMAFCMNEICSKICSLVHFHSFFVPTKSNGIFVLGVGFFSSDKL